MLIAELIIAYLGAGVVFFLLYLSAMGGFTPRTSTAGRMRGAFLTITCWPIVVLLIGADRLSR